MEAIPLPGGTWLEPCAGTGSLIQAVSYVREDVEWHAVEIRHECTSRLKDLTAISKIMVTDFLVEFSPSYDRYSVVLTNPPYSLAEKFLYRSLEISDHVVFLLRLNFLASGRRSLLMRSKTPDVYVLPNRPSFNGVGTDSIDYAWFHWHSQSDDRGRLTVLPETPVQERQRDRIVEKVTLW